MDFWRAWFSSLGPEFLPRGWMDGWSASQWTSIRKGQAWWSAREFFHYCLKNIIFCTIRRQWSPQMRLNARLRVPTDGCSPWLPAWATGLRGLRLSPWPPSGSAPWSPAWSAGSSSCRNSLQRCSTSIALICFFALFFFLPSSGRLMFSTRQPLQTAQASLSHFSPLVLNSKKLYSSKLSRPFPSTSITSKMSDSTSLWPDWRITAGFQHTTAQMSKHFFHNLDFSATTQQFYQIAIGSSRQMKHKSLPQLSLTWVLQWGQVLQCRFCRRAPQVCRECFCCSFSLVCSQWWKAAGCTSQNSAVLSKRTSVRTERKGFKSREPDQHQTVPLTTEDLQVV